VPTLIYAARSIHRLPLELLPSIMVTSTNDPTPYALIDANLRPIPLLHIFDKEYFMQHLLPRGTMSYDQETKILDTHILDARINELLEEINHKDKHYKHFSILKNSGFVRYKACGLLIVKFNEYPFVLKLFIEPPKSFVNPYDKGFEAVSIFITGGALRHTLGFIRIKTLEYVQEKIKSDSYWHDKIIMPRKWFWLPKKPGWLTISTRNIGMRPEDHITIPEIYGVIADELKEDDTKGTDYNELMRFSKFLEHRIDPRTKNFFIEKNTGKIALIDTELFPILLGFHTRIQPHDTHVKWYMYLAGKYMEEKFFASKYWRSARTKKTDHYYLVAK
jgi:hypothetical protein